MDKKTLKELIRIYKIDGMNVAEIAAALDISERTVYRYLKQIREEPKVSFKNLKIDFSDIITTIKDLENRIIEEKIMSPRNSGWDMFYKILNIRLDSHPCNSKTLTQSSFVLREFFPKIDVGKSLEYFRSRGGYCDCEVLMNVR